MYWPNRRASKAIEQEKLSEALGQCTGAPQLGWFDDDSDALTNCGVVLAYHENASGDDLKQAKSYWQHVLKYPDISHNNKSAAECDLAALLARGDDPKGAIDLYTSYLSVDPNDGTAQMNLGFLLAQRQQYAEAALHFRAATMIRDDDLRSDASGYLRSALRKQAEAYARSGQWTKATNLLQRAIMTSGSTDYTWSEWEKLLVFCALNAGQWKLAEAKAQILIDNLSGDELAGFYYWLGVARMGEGDRSGALTAFRFVQDHYPRDAWLEHTIEIANGH